MEAYILIVTTNWLDKYKANILSSTHKLRFKYEEWIIEVDIINARDQKVSGQAKKNQVYVLWNRMDKADKKIV